MKRILVGLALVATLAGCGASYKHETLTILGTNGERDPRVIVRFQGELRGVDVYKTKVDADVKDLRGAHLVITYSQGKGFTKIDPVRIIK